MQEQPTARPLTPRCATALALRDHACIGMSPFNGYFTAKRIAWLAAWGLGSFESVHFFVPDGPAAYTLEALGYSPARAAHKAARQGAYLKNKIRRALIGLGIAHPEPYILDSSVLDANVAYRESLAHAHELYERDACFRTACLDASHWVLGGRLPGTGQAPREQRLYMAVRYLLAELPLFADTPAIVARQASVFCYHQSPPPGTALQPRTGVHARNRAGLRRHRHPYGRSTGGRQRPARPSLITGLALIDDEASHP